MKNKPKIVVSAINLFEGGTLSILKNCLAFLTDSQYEEQYEICALVHRKDLFDLDDFANVSFVEFPKSRTSYFYRLYYEYFHFKHFAKENNVAFWLSLHDVTPRLTGVEQAVYCHNSSPFRKVDLKNLWVNPVEFFFTLFYSYLYAINIKKNKFVIVQQQWMREKFSTLFSLDKSNIIVATPNVQDVQRLETASPVLQSEKDNAQGLSKTFIYPTLARSFKNIEVLGDAVRHINTLGDYDFKIVVTINGTENKYARSILEKYGDLKQLVFIGKVDRSKVYQYYGTVDALLFPSTLESWGMPITEFKNFQKPIVVANLPYAKETVNDYDKAVFFRPDDYKSLAHILIDIIEDNDIKYHPTDKLIYEEPYAPDWSALFTLLLS